MRWMFIWYFPVNHERRARSFIYLWNQKPELHTIPPAKASLLPLHRAIITRMTFNVRIPFASEEFHSLTWRAYVELTTQTDRCWEHIFDTLLEFKIRVQGIYDLRMASENSRSSDKKQSQTEWPLVTSATQWDWVRLLRIHSQKVKRCHSIWNGRCCGCCCRWIIFLLGFVGGSHASRNEADVVGCWTRQRSKSCKYFKHSIEHFDTAHPFRFVISQSFVRNE